MLKLLQGMLSDGVDDNISSKRAVTFLAFMLCAIAFISELYWGYKVSATTFDAMMYIAVAGLGFTASEKFARKEQK